MRSLPPLPSRRFCIRTAVFVALVLIGASLLTRDAKQRFTALQSVIVYDRHHVPVVVYQNSKEHYALPGAPLPPEFIERLLSKEDKYFYYHPGVNPFSLTRALWRKATTGRAGGASTITEQLAKNLLGTENERTIRHKVRELSYALSLELFLSKDTILSMYAETVYLGNQVQGFETASHAYFGKSVSETTAHEQMALLATLSYPATRNPWKKDNEPYARALYGRLVNGDGYVSPLSKRAFTLQDPARFELTSLGVTCITSCRTTIDAGLTAAVRTILKRTVEQERERGVRHGAVVVLDARRGEIIALVGSPDPQNDAHGGQINMALSPRPIGSTIKPFIYLEGFMKGLRPYTIVDDREYKYPIATGFSLYPKNYDGRYHGEVTLHQALSNSLNVPSVKILEYLGLPNFYEFLGGTLTLKPVQPFESYQYGIALGGLEMDLLTLTHYFTLFPQGGVLRPLRLSYVDTVPYLAPQSAITKAVSVSEPEYTELVTAILSDRLTGVEQFGLRSTLNLSLPAYAVKTGTSRDWHDSWVVGYTPDLVVGVWLGNSENQPLAQVSGQSGAGTVWQAVMEHLATTPYRSNRVFNTEHITSFPIANSLEWGLPSDVIAEHEALLTSNQLIVSPHHNDRFAFTNRTAIPLRATRPVAWTVNGIHYGDGVEFVFHPPAPGHYEIEAQSEERREIIQFEVIREE